MTRSGFCAAQAFAQCLAMAEEAAAVARCDAREIHPDPYDRTVLERTESERSDAMTFTILLPPDGDGFSG